jgi:hypothetical protein
MLIEQNNTVINLGILKEIESLLRENKLYSDNWLEPVKLHQTLMYHPSLFRQLHERAERKKINKDAVESFLSTIRHEYMQDALKNELKACQDSILQLTLNYNGLSERIEKLMAVWHNETYTFVTYSWAKMRYVFIDTASLQKFNYNLVEIRENLNKYHLTYVEKLEDLTYAN